MRTLIACIIIAFGYQAAAAELPDAARPFAYDLNSRVDSSVALLGAVSPTDKRTSDFLEVAQAQPATQPRETELVLDHYDYEYKTETIQVAVPIPVYKEVESAASE